MNNLLVNGVFVQLGDKYLDNNMRVGREVKFVDERGLKDVEYKMFNVVTDDGKSTIFRILFVVEEFKITMVLTNIFDDEKLVIVEIDVEDEMNS